MKKMLTYQDIIKEDNEDLRKKSLPVSLPLTDEDKHTLRLMVEYLINSYDEEACDRLGIRPGVGLSAVQVDVLKRMFAILGFDEEGKLHRYGVINPKIISHSEELTFIPTGEGCLSVDRETHGFVHRPKRITAKCHLFDFDSFEVTEATLKLKGYMAVVFQHEYDHLQGILFVDHIRSDNPFFIPENSSPVVFMPQEETKE